MKLQRFQKGVSLLETTIAILVLSVGMLSMATLMLTNMRNNDATLSRTQSTILANEIYEKMLANLPVAAAGSYDLTMDATLPDSYEMSCSGISANCTPEQLAVWDLGQWGARVIQVMPRADAAIDVDASVDPYQIVVQISFDALLETDGFTTESFTFMAR